MIKSYARMFLRSILFTGAPVLLLPVLTGCALFTGSDRSAVPAVSIAANPTTIPAGTASTLTVTAINATQVTVTGSDGTTYNLPLAGGTQAVSPKATTTYTAVATAKTGVTASATATITVLPAPTVTISANPATINARVFIHFDGCGDQRHAGNRHWKRWKLVHSGDKRRNTIGRTENDDYVHGHRDRRRRKRIGNGNRHRDSGQPAIDQSRCFPPPGEPHIRQLLRNAESL